MVYSQGLSRRSSENALGGLCVVLDGCILSVPCRLRFDQFMRVMYTGPAIKVLVNVNRELKFKVYKLRTKESRRDPLQLS